MMKQQLTIFGEDQQQDVKKRIVNVSSVSKRSPFRYPGGKTWLIPIVRKWLKQDKKVATELIEPFAGGGIVSLTTAFENLATSITMVEKDEEVAAVWEVVLNEKNEWLAEKIYNFDLTIDNIKAEFEKTDKQLHDIAFCTILKNRVFHGGIITKGAGLIKNGENGKGIYSRWYPKTLRDRILAINYIKNKIIFITGDAFDIIESNKSNKNAYFFIDPPYLAAGKRLYTHYEIDHKKLFELIATIKGRFMLTYDDAPEIRMLIKQHNLSYRLIPMKTTHHLEKNELIIADNFDWWVEDNLEIQL